MVTKIYGPTFLFLLPFFNLSCVWFTISPPSCSFTLDFRFLTHLAIHPLMRIPAPTRTSEAKPLRVLTLLPQNKQTSAPATLGLQQTTRLDAPAPYLLPTIHQPCDSSCRMADSGEQQCQSSSTPPPLSINQLLALHPREQLQVHPLRWTDRQLDLLGCRVHSRHDEAQSIVADENAEAASSKPGRLAGVLAKRLTAQVCPDNLVDIVRRLLVPLDARKILFQMKYVGPTQPLTHSFQRL